MQQLKDTVRINNIWFFIMGFLLLFFLCDYKNNWSNWMSNLLFLTLTAPHPLHLITIRLALTRRREQLITIPGTFSRRFTCSAVRVLSDWVFSPLVRITWKSGTVLSSSWLAPDWVKNTRNASFAPNSKNGKISVGLVWRNGV